MSYLLYVIRNLKVSPLSLETQFLNINLIFKLWLLLSDIWKLVIHEKKKKGKYGYINEKAAL